MWIAISLGLACAVLLLTWLVVRRLRSRPVIKNAASPMRETLERRVKEGRFSL